MKCIHSLLPVTVFHFIKVCHSFKCMLKRRMKVNVGEERLRYDGPHGFEKHSIVLAKLTNTVSRYPQESTIHLNRSCCKQINTVSDKNAFFSILI